MRPQLGWVGAECKISGKRALTRHFKDLGTQLFPPKETGINSSVNTLELSVSSGQIILLGDTEETPQYFQHRPQGSRFSWKNKTFLWIKTKAQKRNRRKKQLTLPNILPGVRQLITPPHVTIVTTGQRLHPSLWMRTLRERLRDLLKVPELTSGKKVSPLLMGPEWRWRFKIISLLILSGIGTNFGKPGNLWLDVLLFSSVRGGGRGTTY